MTEQNKQSDQQQRDQRQQTDQHRNQEKAVTQRRAEEAARRDKPKGGVSSVGTIESQKPPGRRSAIEVRLRRPAIHRTRWITPRYR